MINLGEMFEVVMREVLLMCGELRLVGWLD